MDNLKNKKDDYEILSIKMKEHINQLAALPKHEILNRGNIYIFFRNFLRL